MSSFQIIRVLPQGLNRASFFAFHKMKEFAEFLETLNMAVFSSIAFLWLINPSSPSKEKISLCGKHVRLCVHV
jgi:hypothetical protein